MMFSFKQKILAFMDKQSHVSVRERLTPAYLLLKVISDLNTQRFLTFV